jgi:hypothetical protein
VVIVRFLSGSGNHSQPGIFAVARLAVNLAQTMGEVDTPVDAVYSDRVLEPGRQPVRHRATYQPPSRVPGRSQATTNWFT